MDGCKGINSPVLESSTVSNVSSHASRIMPSGRGYFLKISSLDNALNVRAALSNCPLVDDCLQDMSLETNRGENLHIFDNDNYCWLVLFTYSPILKLTKI